MNLIFTTLLIILSLTQYSVSQSAIERPTFKKPPKVEFEFEKPDLNKPSEFSLPKFDLNTQLNSLNSENNGFGPNKEVPFGMPYHVVNPKFPKGIKPSNEDILLEFTLDKSGNVIADTIIVSTSTNSEYDNNSIEALSQYKFNPKEENGVAVIAPKVKIMIQFRVN
ncbi:MAG: energy transducer TonB [Kordiimonadaceae bacterium]|jgi:TonB family protein|nr:energy transducer TonB [Kordiimonadaceae bacterium]MBT6033600.1 energy transducer TonB [Kordiimonadaceae bacterium]